MVFGSRGETDSEILGLGLVLLIKSLVVVIFSPFKIEPIIWIYNILMSSQTYLHDSKVCNEVLYYTKHFPANYKQYLLLC